MAFLIPDNLTSRADVPAAVKKVARAFRAGLDESVTVWYEPPFDLAGRRPDLVLLAPDEGVVVLDVQAGAVEEQPLQRAEAFANHLKQRIAAERRLAGIAVPVGAGAAFPDLARAAAEERGLDRTVPLDRCLFAEEIEAGAAGEGETGLRRAFARMRLGAQPAWLDDEQLRIVRGLMHPDTIIDAIAEPAAGEHRQLVVFRPPDEEAVDVVRVMDREQERLAKSIGEGHRVVRGVAGSGKTLLLVYRARFLAEHHPGWRILVTCFSRPLAAVLGRLLSAFENVEVRNFDGLLRDWIEAADMEHPGYGDRTRDRVLDVGLEALAALDDPPVYDAVLIDEAQDFSSERLRALVGLLREGGDLIAVADPAQNIFRRDFSWRAAGIQAQGRTRVLRANYRNTREVLDFASRFLFPDGIPEELDDDETAIVRPAEARRRGPAPVVAVVADLDAEIEAVVRAVAAALDEGREPRGVAVLYATSAARGADRAALLNARLKELDAVLWVTSRVDLAAKDQVAAAAEPIVLSTLHSAKGLEFPTVVLAGLSWGEADQGKRMAAYVGMTRATRRLHVVVQESDALAEPARQAAETAD